MDTKQSSGPDQRISSLAARLTVSVRTVERRHYLTSTKLGATRRADLATLIRAD